MKSLLIMIITFSSLAAWATPKCASKNSEIANIKPLLKKVNIFASWSGIWDGKSIKAKLSKNSAGQFVGQVDYDGDKYGPASIKLCIDGNGSYFMVVYGYEIDFDVLSSKKIKGYSPFDVADTVILSKK